MRVRRQWMGALACFSSDGRYRMGRERMDGRQHGRRSLTPADFEDDDVRRADVRNENFSNGGLQAEDLSRTQSLQRAPRQGRPRGLGRIPEYGSLCGSDTNCPLAFDRSMTSVRRLEASKYCIGITRATPSTGSVTASIQYDHNATVVVANGPAADNACGTNTEFYISLNAATNLNGRSYWFEVLPVEAGLG